MGREDMDDQDNGWDLLEATIHYRKNPPISSRFTPVKTLFASSPSLRAIHCCVQHKKVSWSRIQSTHMSTHARVNDAAKTEL